MPQARADIHVGVRMVNDVELPQDRQCVKSTMLEIAREIEQQEAGDECHAGGQSQHRQQSKAALGRHDGDNQRGHPHHGAPKRGVDQPQPGRVQPAPGSRARRLASRCERLQHHRDDDGEVEREDDHAFVIGRHGDSRRRGPGGIT